MRKHTTSWLLVAAGGLLLSSSLTADDGSAEGVVRLGSARPLTSASRPQVSSNAQQVSFHGGQSACGNGACGSGDGIVYGDSYIGDSYGPACGVSGGYGCPYDCGDGACGYGHCGRCGLIGHLRNHAVGGCHHSPDHGWAPPGKHPRPRLAATYRNWFPGSWTGEQSPVDPCLRYPMVYTPTDTTQLGYYHQRVPVWQRRAGMIPPVPHPDTFHVPNFGGGCGSCGGAGGVACGYQSEYGGQVVGGYSGYPVGDSYSHGNTAPAASVEGGAVEAPTAPATEPGEGAEPYFPAPSNGDSTPAAPAPEPPAGSGPTASGLEKSALAPILYAIPRN